jgi:hypothetical protein
VSTASRDHGTSPAKGVETHVRKLLGQQKAAAEGSNPSDRNIVDRMVT